MWTVLRSILGNQTKRFGRVDRRMCWEEKVYALNLKEIFFPIDMAAEGHGNTILTRALQLVSGTTKLLGDFKTYSHLFPFEKRE